MNNIDNVVVVVLDALRADRIGCLGNDGGLTPHLDALAADGTAFESAFTCASNTDPSVTSILTGRYPRNSVLHHGKLVTKQEKQRIEAIPSIAMLLSDAGWETASVGQAMGRWHARGFDHYPETSEDAQLRTWSMGIARRGFDVIERGWPALASAIRRVYHVGNRDMQPDVVMQDYDPIELIEVIDSEPFFGFVHLMDTHMPYLGTAEDFDDLVSSGNYPEITLDEFLAEGEFTEAQVERLENAIDRLGLDYLGELPALYDAAVRYADRKVGWLVDRLKESDMLETTAVFVTADHGESLLEHGIFLDHHGLYEEVLHVPLITNLGSGSIVDEMIQLTDLAPTVMDLLDVDRPPMDGQSLVPLITNRGRWGDREAIYAEEAYTERRVGIRTEEWKYIFHRDDPVLEQERGSSLKCGYCDMVHGSEEELFNLSVDVAEMDEVSEANPEVAASLRDTYESFVDDLVEIEDVDGHVYYEHEDAVLDRLEAIGYR